MYVVHGGFCMSMLMVFRKEFNSRRAAKIWNKICERPPSIVMHALLEWACVLWQRVRLFPAGSSFTWKAGSDQVSD
jgi:hypothetical protein